MSSPGREEDGVPLHGLWYRLRALADIGRLVGQWGDAEEACRRDWSYPLAIVPY